MSEAHYQREVEWYETLLTQKSKKIVEMQAEIERLRAALREVAEYEIEDGCPCSACQYSALARAALEKK